MDNVYIEIEDVEILSENHFNQAESERHVKS